MWWDVGLWVWCWNQDAINAVDGERVSDQKKKKKKKKSTDESVKDQGDVGCVFCLERHCPLWICTMLSDGKQTVVPGSFSAFEDAVCRKRPEQWENQTWMLHGDNAPAHASLLNRSYLAKHQTFIVPHPPNSPDLAPADFFLFPKLKPTLKGRRFQITEEIQESAIRELCAIT